MTEANTFAIRVDASEYQLRREVDAVRALKAALSGYEDDDQLLHDSIEGETNLFEIIDALVDAIGEDEERITGIKERVVVMQMRKDRFERRIEARRAMIEQALTIAEQKNLELPEATLSIKDKPRKTVIEDESLIPSTYWQAQPPKLDRKALNDALKAGQNVPGATQDNGGISLQIRRK